MGRAKLPSILTLIGVVISVLITIIPAAAHSYIISNHVDGTSLGNQMMLIGVIGSIGHAAGVGFFWWRPFLSVEITYRLPIDTLARDEQRKDHD